MCVYVCVCGKAGVTSQVEGGGVCQKTVKRDNVDTNISAGQFGQPLVILASECLCVCAGVYVCVCRIYFALFAYFCAYLMRN